MYIIFLLRFYLPGFAGNNGRCRACKRSVLVTTTSDA